MLIRYFIPHKANEYKPHFLRPKNSFVVGLFVVGLEALFLIYVSLVLPNANFLASILSNVLVNQTNENRVVGQLSSLTVSPTLERAAQEKANDMATKGYFAHTSPEGVTPWHWFSKNGYSYTYAGENLAVNFSDSKDVTDAWMNSPGHRANILNNHFTEIGIATAHGIYEGRETVFVVELFGRPAPLIVSPAPKPVPTVQKPPVISAVVEKPILAPTGTQELFVAVKGAEATQNETENLPKAENTPAALQVNFIEKAIATPRGSVNTVYFGLGLLTLIALLLVVFVEMRVQHPSLIASGVTLVLIISSVIAVNSTLLSQVRIL